MSALTDTFTGIANAIRSKTGGSSTFTPAQMITEIVNIPTATLEDITVKKNGIITAGENFSNVTTLTFPTLQPASFVHCNEDISTFDNIVSLDKVIIPWMNDTYISSTTVQMSNIPTFTPTQLSDKGNMYRAVYQGLYISKDETGFWLLTDKESSDYVHLQKNKCTLEYTSNVDADGYSQISIDVPTNFGAKTFSSNGTYFAEDEVSDNEYVIDTSLAPDSFGYYEADSSYFDYIHDLSINYHTVRIENIPTFTPTQLSDKENMLLVEGDSTNGVYVSQDGIGFWLLITGTAYIAYNEFSVYARVPKKWNGYSAVKINVNPSVGTKTITENGTYNASDETVSKFSTLSYANISADSFGHNSDDIRKKGYDIQYLKSFRIYCRASSGSSEEQYVVNVNDIPTFTPTQLSDKENMLLVASYESDTKQLYVSKDESGFWVLLVGNIVFVRNKTMAIWEVPRGWDGYSQVTVSVPSGGSWINPNEYKESTITSYIGSENLILDNAFSKCTNLTSISFPGCNYIGNYAFVDCNNLTTVSFPNCSYIGSFAFNRCSSLTTVLFPSVSYIGNTAFAVCTSLSEATFPECSYIGAYAFNKCSNLTTISFPKCTYISYNAFVNCTNLSNILFPNVSYIGSCAFACCISLTEASFPMCQYIDSYAFTSTWEGQCSNLSWLYLLSTSVATLANSNAFNNTPLSAGGTGFIYVPNDLVDTYKAADNWSYISDRIYTDSIPNNKYANSTITSYTGGELSIGDSAFYSCSNLTTVNMPNCSYIGSSAFYNCYSLSEVSFPNVSSIGSSAFMYCSSLTTVSFPNVSYIGSNAFYGCTLSNISFPECVYVDNKAFMNCKSLTTVSFPNCSYIANSAFMYCSSLTTVSFPNVSYIGSSAFYGCTSLSNISFPECEYVGSYAFAGNRYYSLKLTTISLPKCSYIASYAFNYCTSLSEVSFPNCSYIGTYAFANCTSLSEVSFPNVSYIGDCAFNYCPSLSEGSFPNCSYIGTYAFANCTSLTQMYLLSTSVASLVNSNAFNNTPLSAGGTGTIYVPSSLYNSYITANNWSALSARISSM